MAAAPDLHAPVPPETGDGLLKRAFDGLYAGEAAAAAGWAQRALACDPANPEGWSAIAEAFTADLLPLLAVPASARAERLDPDRWAYRLAYAEALLAAGLPDALARFEVLNVERPDSAPARRGLARALAAAGRVDEAVAEFREVLALSPDDAVAAVDMAGLLVRRDEAVGALEVLQGPLRRLGHRADLQCAAGRAWMALGEMDRARAAFLTARDLDPEDRHGAGRLLDALATGGAATVSHAYVRALFDRYADRFDRDLLDRLGYAVPELLRGAVDRVSPGASGLRVLDVGCGTGLAGLAFRDVAAVLAGVDLAPRMVMKARERGIYHEVSVGDAVTAMAVSAGGWDLIIAADVLVYIGDLEPVFAAAARGLRTGGLFAATVERHMGAGFILGPTRRYAHSAAYLRACAIAAGLQVCLVEDCAPRREKGEPVSGLLIVARLAPAGRTGQGPMV